MTAIERLRRTVSCAVNATVTPDIAHVDPECYYPLTMGDARALLALVEACQSYLVKMNEPDDFVDGACDDKREAVFSALAAVTECQLQTTMPPDLPAMDCGSQVGSWSSVAPRHLSAYPGPLRGRGDTEPTP